MSDADTRLIEYALGTLDRQACVELEQELETQPQLQHELQAILISLEPLEEEILPVPVSERLRNRIVANVGGDDHLAGYVERISEFYQLNAQTVHELLATLGPDGDEKWVESGVVGTRFFHFEGGPRFTGAHCGLVRMEAGATFPEHRHLGDEWVFMLQGALREDGGAIVLPGDIHHMPAGSRHSFQAVGDELAVYAVALYDGFELTTQGSI